MEEHMTLLEEERWNDRRLSEPWTVSMLLNSSMTSMLDMSIDRHSTRAVICLAGRLDSTTSAKLISAIEDLLLIGVCDFTISSSELDVADTAGPGVLADLFHLMQRHGARLQWDGATSIGFRALRGLSAEHS
jgi:ABC-type transporter Mla MlaB component